VVNYHSYLGVTVSSDLRQHEHVNNVSAKATKTLNFIRCNVCCFPPDTKATAYISLVHSHLEYAAAAWDPYLVGDCKQLEKCSIWLLVSLRKWLRIWVDILLARGLRIRVKTIGGFLHFIRQVAHCVFHCAVHFLWISYTFIGLALGLGLRSELKLVVHDKTPL